MMSKKIISATTPFIRICFTPDQRPGFLLKIESQEGPKPMNQQCSTLTSPGVGLQETKCVTSIIKGSGSSIIFTQLLYNLRILGLQIEAVKCGRPPKRAFTCQYNGEAESCPLGLSLVSSRATGYLTKSLGRSRARIYSRRQGYAQNSAGQTSSIEIYKQVESNLEPFPGSAVPRSEVVLGTT